MEGNSKLLLGIALGVASGALVSKMINSKKNLLSSQDSGRFFNEIKNLVSNVSDFFSEKFIKNLKGRNKFRESNLERTRSTASQFNSY